MTNGPCCQTIEVVQVPGPNGDAGTSGSNGINAFTITTADFVLPAIGSTVTALVGSSLWMGVGQDLYASDGTDFAHFKAVSFPGATSVLLRFMGYTGDAAPGATINSNATISPSGPLAFTAPLSVAQGGTGAATVAAALAALGLPTQFVVGTFTANGASAVTVAQAAITANSVVVITLKTVGGTVGATMTIQTITPATGFTVKGIASDTSVYNYLVIG